MACNNSHPGADSGGWLYPFLGRVSPANYEVTVPLQVVAAVIERQDRRLLIGQRRAHDSSPLKWEFPGGKVKQGETPEQALARELREELDATLVHCALIGNAEYVYPERGPVKVSFFAAKLAPGELRPAVFSQIAWVLPRELGGYDFLPANARLVAELATGRIKPGDFLLNEGSPAGQ